MGGQAVLEKLDKVVLAYSGGLDTSVMLHWIKERLDGIFGSGPESICRVRAWNGRR